MGNVIVQGNDTWEWDGEFWTQLADTGPAGRQDHALCFDSARQTALLFGGWVGNTPMGDTWSWNGEDWTQLDVLDRQPVRATLWSLTQRVAARCFLVEMRQLESLTTRGSGTARPGPKWQTQVHRLDGSTRWPST